MRCSEVFDTPGVFMLLRTDDYLAAFAQAADAELVTVDRVFRDSLPRCSHFGSLMTAICEGGPVGKPTMRTFSTLADFASARNCLPKSQPPVC